MSYIDLNDPEYIDEIIEAVQKSGYYVVKKELSLLDHCKITHFLKIMDRYSIDEIEKRLPENPF